MITSLNELRRQFLEAEIGMSIPSEIDIETAENKWLSILSGLDELTPKPDLFRALFQTQNAKRWDDYLIALGFSGSRETMLRDFYSSDLSFNAMLTSDLDLIFGEDKVWTFDGVDDYIEVPELGIGKASAFSIEVKFNSSDVNVTDKAIFHYSLASDDRFGIVIRPDSLRIGIYDGVSYFAVKSTSISKDTDYVLKVSFDGSSTMVATLNDVVMTGSLTPGLGSSGLGIGGIDNTGLRNLTGNIDYLKVWDDTTQTNLIAYYNLLDSSLGSDNVKDLSGNGNHGTSYGKGKFTRTTSGTVTDYAGNIVSCGIDVPRFEGARFINDDKGWSDKMPEKAIEFDETGRVIIPEFDLIGDRTFSISFTPSEPISGLSPSYYLFDSSDSSNRYLVYARSGDEYLGLYANSTNIGSFNVLHDEWEVNKKIEIVVVFISGATKIYINGALKAISTTTFTHSSFQKLSIGSRYSNTEGARGSMENTIVWNTGLTGEQAMQQYLYNKKGSDYLVARENVVGAWKLDDTTSTIVDYSGNGNDGTFYSGGTESTPTLVDGVYDSDSSISDSLLKGILIEEQRTNLFLNSEDFTLSKSLSNGTTSTVTTTDSPLDSKFTKLIAPTGTGYYGFAIDNTVTTDDTDYTYSIICKADEFEWCRMGISDKGGYSDITWFNLSTGTIGTDESGGTAKIKSLKDGSYRCSVTRNVGTGTNVVDVFFRMTDGDGISTATGNGSDGILVNGVQFEKGTFATSYIPTDSASVTRTADILSYDIESNLEQGYGSLYAEFKCSGNDAGNYPQIFQLYNSDASSYIGVYIHTTLKALYGRVKNGATTISSSSVYFDYDVLNKLMITYGDGEFKTYFNGSLVSTKAATIPTDLESLNVGVRADTAYMYSGDIQNVKYYKEALSETKAKEMTK